MSALASLDLKGKRVLVRVDFNVPFDEAGAISDDTRVRAALPTIRLILAKGGLPILLSHLGRPKGAVVEALRLDALGRRLAELLGTPVQKLDESIGREVEAAIERAPAGSTILLENVRFHAGETKGDPELSAAFARLGDVFVNDAFGASHRAHCSVSGIAGHLPAYAGLLVDKERKAFERVLVNPAQPFLAILGGAKVSDKLPVIENLLDKVHSVLIGGAMAYTFLEARGVSVGASRVEREQLELVRATDARAQKLGVELCLPSDHVVARELSAGAATQTTPGAEIPAGWMGLDIGPRTRREFAERIARAQTVVWNGPMGVFEMEPFRAGSEAVARALSRSQAYSVVGGGDSVAAVQMFGVADQVDHISTGGGASLELLGGLALPGLSGLR